MNKQLTSLIKIMFNPLVIGITMFLCGLVIGLPVLGWWLWPVKWTDVPQTPLATHTPYPTYTPYPTLLPTLTATPGPDAVVTGAIANLMEGPELTYAVVGQANQANELQVIGQYGNCSWLKVTTPAQLTGWLVNDGSAVSLQKACEAIPTGTFRPVTGVFKPLGTVGEGQLTIDNGSSNDAIIILTYSSAPAESLAATYVRSGEKYVLSGVPDGEYIIFFAVGSEWNGEEFTQDKRIERFEESFNFYTSTTEYTIWDITLHPVPGGTGTVEEVPPEEFPSIN